MVTTEVIQTQASLYWKRGEEKQGVACFIPATEEHTVSFGESQGPPEESEVLDTQEYKPLLLGSQFCLLFSFVSFYCLYTAFCYVTHDINKEKKNQSPAL